MVTTMRSTPRTASGTDTAVAPVSAAKSDSVSGPREFATKTLCPSAVRRRVSVPPIWPAPMMPIFMFASYGLIAEATGGSRKPMSASSGADYPARQYMGLNFYREDPRSPHMNLKPARVGGSGDGAGNTAPHEFCSTSSASERVPASERCTWGASNRNQNFHLRTGLTRRRLWSLLTQTVTMAEPDDISEFESYMPSQADGSLRPWPRTTA